MPPSPDTTETPAKSNWLAYVLPMVLFLGLLAALPLLSLSYPITYMITVAAVTGATIWGAKVWRSEIRFETSALAIGVVVGLIGLPLWLGIDAITPPLKFLGTRTAYNPFVEIADPLLRNTFIAVRLYGLAILIPVVEEVFWRSFLLRYVTDQDKWSTLAVGTFSTVAFAVVVGLFGFAHPEYLAGITYGVMMALLLRQTKSLFACIIAHGVTNLALGIYVLTTGHWEFW